MPCPTCGSTTFTVGRDVTIWQTLRIRLTDTLGNYEVEDDELHDISDTEGFVDNVTCEECGAEWPLSTIFPQQKEA